MPKKKVHTKVEESGRDLVGRAITKYPGVAEYLEVYRRYVTIQSRFGGLLSWVSPATDQVVYSSDTAAIAHASPPGR